MIYMQSVSTILYLRFTHSLSLLAPPIMPGTIQVSDIADYLNNSQYRVILRSCKYSTGAKKQTDCLPRSFILQINETKLQITNKYTFTHFDITRHIISSITSRNTSGKTVSQISINIWIDPNSKETLELYYFGFFLLKQCDIQQFLEDLKLQKPLDQQITIEQVNQKLDPDDDEIEIVENSRQLKLSLLCPVRLFFTVVD